MPIPSFTQTQLKAGAPGPETALTIGVLDGVHRGHQALIGRLRDEARARALSPGVVTLHPHPITVLRPEIPPSYLSSLDDRIELMRAAGADWVLPLTFTSEVSEVESEELASAFHDLLRMRLLVLGPDGAFGTDLRWYPRPNATFRPYAGGGLTAHVINAEGKIIAGSFVERALDNITAGVAGMGGVDLVALEHVSLGAQARFDLLSGSRFASVRFGGSYIFGRSRPHARPQ